MVKTRKPTSGLCAETRSNNGHGSWQSLSAWVSAQPAPTCHCLSFLSLPPPALPPHFPLSISLSSHSSFFGSPPPTPTTNTTTPPHLSFSQQGSSGHCSLSNPLPIPTRILPPPPLIPLLHPLFLSERMFQPLHTDSSGILCVEMFLLDLQALTIYRTKASVPLLKAWHL